MGSRREARAPVGKRGEARVPVGSAGKCACPLRAVEKRVGPGELRGSAWPRVELSGRAVKRAGLRRGIMEWQRVASCGPPDIMWIAAITPRAGRSRDLGRRMRGAGNTLLGGVSPPVSTQNACIIIALGRPDFARPRAPRRDSRNSLGILWQRAAAAATAACTSTPWDVLSAPPCIGVANARRGCCVLCPE